MAWNLGLLGASLPGSAPAYELLETVTLSTDTATVSFTGLGAYSDYKHLQIRSAMGMVSNTNYDLRFNGDSTTGNYWFHYMAGSGGSVGSSAVLNRNAIRGRAINSSTFGASIIDILDFNSTAKIKTTRALDGNALASNQSIWFVSGAWNSTSAITSITLSGPTANILANSRFSLYGVK